MKKIFSLLLVTVCWFAARAQVDVRANRVIVDQSFYLRNWWIDTLQRDTAFAGDNKLPTSKAVRDFVAGRIAHVAVDTSSLVHKLYSLTEMITGSKTFNDTTFLNLDLPISDSSYKLINSKFAKQIFAQKVTGVFPLYSIPVANSTGQLAATADFTYDNSTSNLNVGYGGFYSSSGINLHGGNGIISAGGWGLQFIAQGGYPVDPSKSYTFYNSGYLYQKMYTTGVAGSWDHFTDFYTRHFKVRGLGADSAALTNTGTVHMLTVDANGQFNHQVIPTGISLTSLSATSPIFYNNTTGIISSQAATASLNGYLTYTDWNTFNNKQAPLLNPITGNATTLNYLTKIIGTNSVGNSIVYDNGTTVGINTATPDASARLDIVSTTRGVLLPRLTNAQMVAIASPASGLMVINTDSAYRPFIYNGTSWVGFLRYIDLPVTTLNSDALTLFTVTSGIFSVNSQTANTVWAAPNGSTGVPVFRALVSADIPNISESQVTNLTTDLAGKANIYTATIGTDANITATVNKIYILPAATLTAGRTFTMPAGSAVGDQMTIMNREQGFAWTLAGYSIYFPDGVTTLPTLYAQVNMVLLWDGVKWNIAN